MVSLFQCKLNLCLGLKYKKLMVEQIMNTNKINILCQQEVDLEVGYCENSLSIPGYDLLIGKKFAMLPDSGPSLQRNLKLINT